MIDRRWTNLVATTASVFLAAAAVATEIDVNGNWQLTYACGPSSDLTGTLSFGIVEDLNTGDVTLVSSPDCGTSVTDGALRVVQSCSSTPSPQTGKVTGTQFSTPASGYRVSDSTFQTPFASPTYGCLNPPLARIVLEVRVDGVITDDGFGYGTRIDGTAQVGQVTAYDPQNNVCNAFNLGGASVCTVTVRRSDVTVGSNVTIEPRPGSTVTFSQVTGGGTATITPLVEPSAALPPNFQLLGAPVYFDVSTTAQVSGPITVCLPYDDIDSDGFVDGTNPAVDETTLLLLHEEAGVFVDRTLSIDTGTNQVCAQTDSLSQFLKAQAVPARAAIDYTPVSAGKKDSASLSRQKTLGTASRNFTTQKYNLLRVCADALQEYKARQTAGLPAAQIQAALVTATKVCVEPSATAPDTKTMLGKIGTVRTTAIRVIQQHCGTPGGTTVDGKPIGNGASDDLTVSETTTHVDLVGCEAERLLGLAYVGIRTDLSSLTARASQGGMALSLSFACLDP